MKHYWIIVLVFVISCGDQDNQAISSQETILDNNELEEASFNQSTQSTKSILSIRDSVIIDLKDFEIVLLDYLCYNSENLAVSIGDTIYLNEEAGFSLDNHLLTINPKSDNDDFEIYVSLEQDLRVYVGEKQFRDLDKWHLESPFLKVQDSAKYHFRLPSYDYDTKQDLVSKQLNAVKKAILELEGEYITASLDTITAFNRLPVELWISRVIIKIRHLPANGEERVVLLINQPAWGC